MQSEHSVQQMVDKFYAALNQVYTGDAGPIVNLWSEAPYVSAMHSLGDHEVGFQQVQAVWKRVASRVTEGKVTFEPLQIHAHGDMGFAVGIERGSIVIDGNGVDVLLRVTNIFEKSSGEWKVVHHHADTVPVLVTALG